MATAFLMKAAVSATGLRVRCGTTEVLRGVDLRVDAGECVAVVGSSGGGKSTLLHALAGHLPRQGSVHIGGELGMVFQNNAVFPWMTVERNIAFGLPHGESGAVEQALQMAGLAHRRGAYPHELSGGQTQRIAVARSLARRPDVLLMDEPFGALDACTRERMQHWLTSVLDAHRPAVVLVTHSVEEAILLSDRVLVLRDGVIACSFTSPFGRAHGPDIVYSPAFTELRKTITGMLE